MTFTPALKGIKVVEFADMVSGPYCGKLLADMGAEVVKVEPPEGDLARRCGPFPDNRPDPERSALFLYNNTSKRGVVLDLNHPGDLNRFKHLVCWADVLIDNHAPEVLEKVGLDEAHLRQFNPGLIFASITPYGRTGPRVGNRGDELTLSHAGGVANLLPAQSEDLDKPPVKMAGYYAGYHAAVYAAVAIMASIIGKTRTRQAGQLIDISIYEAVISLIGPTASLNRYYQTSWCRIPDRPPASGRMKTDDGYVNLMAVDDHHFRTLRDLIGNPDWLADDRWDDMIYRYFNSMEIAESMADWFKKQKTEDFYQSAGSRGIPVGPFNNAREVMESRQYAARSYFTHVDHPAAGKYRYAGWPFKMGASPPKISRPAPLLGQHTQEVFDQLPEIQVSDHAPAPQVTDTQEKDGTGKLPLEGLRILDVSWVVAGPHAGMLLANLGAEVIKVEGHNRTDLLRRLPVWPLPEAAPLKIPINQNLIFICANLNKKGLTLDLTQEKGRKLVTQLATKCDVVLNNMRPGVMENLGLGHETLAALKPEIISLTSSSRGENGPESAFLGFAGVHQAYGGLAYMSGYPDGHPTTGASMDADILNGTIAAFAILAAYYHRLQTGQGQFIDYSQCEGVSSIIGDALLGYEMTREIPERIGNTHPLYAPYGVYRCWGADRWLALEIHSDSEFAVLAGVMNQPELETDVRFATMASRKKNEKALNTIIESWTRKNDRDRLERKLCRAGLIAAPSREGRDLYADAHLKARGFIESIHHPEMGELELFRPPWRLSGCRTPIQSSPLLGQHDLHILKDLLGLDERKIQDLKAAGTIC